MAGSSALKTRFALSPGHDDAVGFLANLSHRLGRTCCGHPRLPLGDERQSLELAMPLRRTHQALVANFKNLTCGAIEKIIRGPPNQMPAADFPDWDGRGSSPRVDVMSLYALLAVYLTAAFSLVGGVAAALVSLAGPAGPATSLPVKLTSGESTREIIVEPHPQAFRYGPEINHGRSDTPVYARQQALREARALAPSGKIQRPDRGHIGLTHGPGPSFGHTPSVPSSGH
jgi:hypothetical protein